MMAINVHRRLGLLTLAALLAMAVGCKDVAVEPQDPGRIEGVVKQFETDEPVQGALITTHPATNSVGSENDGRFVLEPVSPDTYRVEASKPGYVSKSVGVSLSEGQDVRAVILMEKVEEDSVAMNAEITNWWVREEAADSLYANVEYEVKNTGTRRISGYEVYFEISTSNGTFSREINGGDLSEGQIDVGEFEKFVRATSVDEVRVKDTWFTDGSGGKRRAMMR